MIAGPPASPKWARSRFALAVAIVFALQLALIFWFGARSVPAPSAVGPVPVLRVDGGPTNGLLALEDPTLFVLPHREGFSGAAWLQAPALQYHPQDWSEPPRWLSLPTRSLAGGLDQFVHSNLMAAPEFAAMPPPQSGPQVFLEPLPVLSGLRIGGELARRPLLRAPALPGQTNSDLLTNSDVQVLVDARGNVFSAVVLQSCGNAGADQAALDLARNARFAPLSRGGPGALRTDRLSFGELIFQWQTLPGTNGLAP